MGTFKCTVRRAGGWGGETTDVVVGVGTQVRTGAGDSKVNIWWVSCVENFLAQLLGYKKFSSSIFEAKIIFVYSTLNTSVKYPLWAKDGALS